MLPGTLTACSVIASTTAWFNSYDFRCMSNVDNPLRCQAARSEAVLVNFGLEKGASRKRRPTIYQHSNFPPPRTRERWAYFDAPTANHAAAPPSCT
jgi:hypothetical protein